MSDVTLPPQTEKAFMAMIVELAALMRWQIYHTHTSLHSAKGFPDLCLARPPRLLFVEVKTQVGKVTPEQERWLDCLKACGQETHVWRPSQWNEIKEILS